MFAKTLKICQQIKYIKTLYGHLPPKNIAELKLWDMVHVDLIGPYKNSILQQQWGGTAILKNDSLTFMMMIEPAAVWFEIIKIPMFDLEEVSMGND